MQNLASTTGTSRTQGPFPPPTNLAAQCLPFCLQNKDAVKLEELGGVEGVARALHTSTDDGLDDSAAGDLSLARRQELYGANVFASVPTQSFWAILWDALSDKVLIVLMIAATVCLRPHALHDAPSNFSRAQTVLSFLLA